MGPSRVRALLGLIGVVAALLPAMPAPAQTLLPTLVRGRITMPDGTTRASGVIVEATGGSAPARALSNPRGEFTIVVPGAGTYALRALRVGFKPTPGPTVTVAEHEAVEVEIRLGGEAVSLRAVTVRGEDACRMAPDSGALVARAWEEARKAILASGLSATDAPLTAQWIEYSRTLDPTGRIVRAQQVRTTTSPTTHAFRSAPAESLATRGYVTLDSGTTTFHAPDGDALLSNAFAATHCFQIAPVAKGADTLVGVLFRPAQDRRDARDIEGTFWLDRRSAELRWLDYRYTNLPASTDRAEPGGRVEFLRLGTGSWLVGRWSIRMPELGRGQEASDAGRRRTIQAPAGGVLWAIQVSGGTVNRVDRGDSTVYRADGAALTIRLVANDATVAIPGTSVELVGTDYRAVAGRDGHAHIAPVLEGRYEARIRTALMDSLGVPPITREFVVTPRAPVDTVRLAGAAELARVVCRDSIRNGEGLLRGTVRDSLGRPVAYASVVVSYQDRMKVIGDARSDRLQWTEQSVASMSDANGRWRACGLPQGTLFTARVKTDAGSDARRVPLEAGASLAAIDLVPHAAPKAVDAVLPKETVALVEFSTRDEDGNPVYGVTLDVETPANGKRTLNTGETGHALLPGISPGRVSVRARKVGYAPGMVLASVAIGRNTVPVVMSANRAPVLDTVRIVGDERRRVDRHDEFETRRLNAAATRSITRDEIVKRNPVDAWQMMTNISAVKIAELGGTVIARSMRVEGTSLLNDRPCYMRVMVDGTLMPEDTPILPSQSQEKGSVYATNLANLPPPDAIYGIEVFAGPSTIPPQYGGTGTHKWCGLIAIWTR
jgi:hypothetical protein